MEKICGIYKIISPKKRIYIGQSVDILRRFKKYKKLSCINQIRLYNSLKKYGFEKHEFEILHQCEREKLNELEKYYIDLFQCFNSEYGLNLKYGGENPVHSKETKNKMSESHKGQIPWIKGKKHSEETRKKMSETQKNRPPMSEKIKIKISEGLKGKICSEETKKKISEKARIRKPSKETKKKISEGMKESWIKRKSTSLQFFTKTK
jgi:group I intron endonuclease